MKKLNLLLVICFFSSILFGQYNLYSDVTNLRGQGLISTSDGGFLLSAIEDCYTPGSLTIEGCIYAIHLVKTDAIGDTIWTNRISYYTQVGPGLSLFQNSDNTYTIVAATNQSFSCNGVLIGLFGFRQIQLFNLDSSGNLINQTTFPDECQLTLKDVVRINDNQFAVLSYYDTPVSSNNIPEGRLFLMDNQGSIQNQINFYNEKFNSGQLIKTASGELALTYISDDNFLQLKRYDYQLNFLNEMTGDNVSDNCIAAYNARVNAEELANGEIGILCDDFNQEFGNVQFSRINASANLTSGNNLTLENPTNFMEDENGNIIIGSTHITADTTFDSQITWLSATGDSLYAEIINGSEDERPEYLLENANVIALAGSVNCCNYEESIGPANSFLYLQDQTNAINGQISFEEHVVISPNPAKNEIMITLENEIKGEQYEMNIFNAYGNNVLTTKIKDRHKRCSITHLSNGIYFYHILSDNKSIQVGKIVKSGD